MPLIVDLSSKNRVIDLDTPLPKGELVAERLTGTETLGRLFQYELMALSANGNIVFDDLLGHHVTALIELTDGSRRPIDGRVSQISLIGMVENLFRYRLVLRPWTWMLTRTADCRIFQDKNVEEILKEVFADQPNADFECNLTAEYAKRVYCVQYRETDFNFVSRLMEEEGIYYFFRHDPGKHTLVICDAPGAHESVGSVPFMPQQQSARSGREYIREWSVTREIQPCKFALRDYNFEKPSSDLLLKLEQDRAHAEATHEIYDYPGEYQEMSVGEHLIRARLDELQAGYEIVEGKADSRLLACGGTFTFTDFGRRDQNGDYLIVSTTIEVTNNALETSKGGLDSRYECSFRLMRADEPFRAARTTPRPIVQGPQTAVVVGPPSEEIFVDEYGRVKVQFHWDRYGKKDDKSSCWIRVSQIWAGKNYGWMSIPRIGQEVVVDFLEGNPDDPLITGRVYNKEQMPPWTLPANKTQSGILTRSSAGGSGETANHLKFEDKKGDELIDIHAEKNMSTHVENDDSTFVGNDQSLVVKRDQSIIIQRDTKEVVTRDRTLNVKNNDTTTISVDQKLAVVGKQDISVDGNQTSVVKGDHALSVVGGITTTTDADRKDITKGSHGVNVTGDQTFVVSGNQTFNIGGNLEYSASNIKLQAGHIDILPTGSSSLVVTSPAGPYQIMANKFQVLSNTDIDLFGIANINSVSVGNNTTVLGSNASGFIGRSSDTNIALASSTTLGVTIDTMLGAQLSTTVAAMLETTVAAKLSMTAGPDLELKTIKMIVPGGGGGGGGGAAAATAGPAWAVNAVKAGLAVSAGFSAWGLYELDDQYDTAAEQLAQAAKDAAEAGHPGLAARLNRLSAATVYTNTWTEQGKESLREGGNDGSLPESGDNIDSTSAMDESDRAHAPRVDGDAPPTPTTDNTGAPQELPGPRNPSGNNNGN